MRPSVLVTGGASFVGCNFVRFLLDREPHTRVVNLDALTYAGSLENLADLAHADRHLFIKGDICDQDLVARILREEQIGSVVNFAAETHVDRSILGAAPFLQTNVMGVLSLLEAAKTVWLHEGGGWQDRRFHHISTDEVYGSLDPQGPPFRWPLPRRRCHCLA